MRSNKSDCIESIGFGGSLPDRIRFLQNKRRWWTGENRQQEASRMLQPEIRNPHAKLNPQSRLPFPAVTRLRLPSAAGLIL